MIDFVLRGIVRLTDRRSGQRSRNLRCCWEFVSFGVIFGSLLVSYVNVVGLFHTHGQRVGPDFVSGVHLRASISQRSDGNG